jgi:hypothetical protein
MMTVSDSSSGYRFHAGDVIWPDTQHLLDDVALGQIRAGAEASDAQGGMSA